jgi:hypothetical protein
MAVELLAYANRQKVADALTEHGYAVTRMTVNRWARGSEMPEIAARMILDLFGHTPETRKQPPPEWARVMQATLDSVHQRQDIIMARQGQVADSASQRIIEALADPERLAWVERMVAEIQAASRTQSDEGSDDPPATEGQGEAGLGGRGLGSSPAQAPED